jgi:hypothetical protein
LNAERAATVAAEVAARHESLANQGSVRMRRLHRTMAATQRRVERRLRRSAEVYRAHARRLMSANLGPASLGVVAGALGARGAALTLLGTTRYEEAAIASSPRAAAVQELEFTLGEGPVHDAAETGRLVIADASSMLARWAQYTPAVTELGVRSVTAAPLCLSRTCIGVLTAFNAPGDTAHAMVDGVAKALFERLLVAETTAADDRSVVHQATGMIAARLRCPVGDALAVLRARAYAENEAIGVLARRVVDREVTFE